MKNNKSKVQAARDRYHWATNRILEEAKESKDEREFLIAAMTIKWMLPKDRLFYDYSKLNDRVAEIDGDTTKPIGLRI